MEEILQEMHDMYYTMKSHLRTQEGLMTESSYPLW